jgi:hypothetical protein
MQFDKDKLYKRNNDLKKKKGWPRKTTPYGAEYQINFFQLNFNGTRRPYELKR